MDLAVTHEGVMVSDMMIVNCYEASEETSTYIPVVSLTYLL